MPDKTLTEEQQTPVQPVAETVKQIQSEDKNEPDIKKEQSRQSENVIENTPKAADVLGIIAQSDGVTLDTLLSTCDISFGELSEILADLEIRGAVSCGAGGIYTVKKER